ncbi:cobaltochelatase subunit CobN [Selenomonas sp. oral taxon 126]|uniref:cobaltochelatase subunit CobN n=1 Tax=Selenomonas sp. oral taxon 126 TaxID=712528 RepID=UPI0008077B78|nr:cobaltochelatase subunit CobN [Selenomonas sp. oral taxon 126]ANR71816.1 cobaltochelatase subunit CobN [Selenomonas sp. oral taxon 126]
MKIAVYTNILRVRVLAHHCAEELKSPAVRVCPADGMDDWAQVRAEADLHLFLWMGTGLDNVFLQNAVRALQKSRTPYLIVVDNAEHDKVSCGFSEEQIQTAWAYFRYDGEENMRNLFLWLGASFGRLSVQAEPPVPLAWNGIYHPDWMGDPEDAAGYLAAHCNAERPTVGVIFYRSEWITGDFTYHAALVRAIEAAGMNAIAVFSNSYRDEHVESPTLMEAIEKYFCPRGQCIVDVIVSTMKFSIKAGGTRIEDLYALSVPILEAYTVLAPKEEWERSPAGLDPMEVSMSVAMPEFDGVIHAVPIAAKVRDESGEVCYAALEERMARIAAKARKWAALRRKSNAEKKIAVVFHNYPPTNANIGSAAGLDSPESVLCLLTAMRAAGYVIDKIPESSKAFMKLLTDHATNDRRFMSAEQARDADGHLTAEQYRSFFKELPEQVRAQLEKDWGDAPGDVFSYDGTLFIPGTLNGNLFITVQPPRGFGEDPGKLLHAPDAAPTHHYVGYYHWLRDIWRADAVIHVGTHGSLEWLPGKGTALSNECYPDVSLGDLPDIYPYWITIVGEGIQAKRRGAACLISHLSPPMELAGGFEELGELEQALDEYVHFCASQPDNIEAAETLVREKAVACHFEDEIAEGEDFSDYAAALHNYVTDIKNMQIRTGLHILGRAPEGERLIDFVCALVRMEHGGEASLVRLIAAQAGYDYEELLTHSERMTADGMTYGRKLDAVESEMRAIIAFLAERDYTAEAVGAAMALPVIAAASAESRAAFLHALREITENIVPRLKKTEQEITGTLRALTGKYIEPSPAGAPTTNGTDVLPTGRNFYGLDPRCMPTPAAWEYGRQLGDALIEQYISDERRYPEAVGIVFWAGSNMRSHGQCIAELFYLMGVRPIWRRPSQRVAGLEIIPLAELKRPRIDVTARISGLFRDAVPNAVHWVDEAVRMVRDLDESDEENYVRKHVLADAAWLEEQGEARENAWARASVRIFGDPPGAYGAGIGDLLESKAWKTLDDLAAVYTRFSGTAYGGDGLARGYDPDLFQRRMAGLDVTVKNEDTRETHMFSSDDYNAYHGGMIATVRALTGKAPRSYTGDSSDRQRIVLRSVDEEAARLFRGEAMNPKFIEGMKAHGYKGASDLANYLAHSYQWDATSAVMKDWMYEGYARKYVLDAGIREWIQDVNPWALHRMAETLLEAQQRGLWNASEETLAELRSLYLSIEGDLEERAEGAQ